MERPGPVSQNMKNITHVYETSLQSNIKLVQLDQKGKYFIHHKSAPGVPRFPPLIKPHYVLTMHSNHKMSET